MLTQVTWTPNTDADLLGYRIYVGRSTGVYDQTFSILGDQLEFFPVPAPAAQVFLPALLDGITYYFAITSIDTALNESAKSAESTCINKYVRMGH
jgi:hypothetical protein